MLVDVGLPQPWQKRWPSETDVPQFAQNFFTGMSTGAGVPHDSQNFPLPTVEHDVQVKLICFLLRVYS